MEVVLPAVPDGFSSLPHWLSNLTDSTLRELLHQGDSQRVRELSLALITVLNEVRPAIHPSVCHVFLRLLIILCVCLCVSMSRVFPADLSACPRQSISIA